MEDGQRKLGRGANRRKENKQNNTAPQPPVSGWEQGPGKTGQGMKLWGLPRGSRPGREIGASTDASPSPSRSPASVSAPGAPTAVGSHLWPFGQLLGKGGGGEGRPERQQEEEAWPPGAAPRGLLPARPLPQPHRHRQACGAPRVPGTAPHQGSRFRAPATESDGQHLASARDLHVICIHLQPHPTPTPDAVRSKDVKRKKIN